MKHFALALALTIVAAPAFAFSVDINMPSLYFPTDAKTVLSTAGK